MTAQVSHKYISLPSRASLSLPPHHLIHLGHHRAPSWASCDVQRLPTSCLFYTWQHIYINAALSICPTLSFPCCVHKSILYIFISIPALKIGSSALGSLPVDLPCTTLSGERRKERDDGVETRKQRRSVLSDYLVWQGSGIFSLANRVLGRKQD